MSTGGPSFWKSQGSLASHAPQPMIGPQYSHRRPSPSSMKRARSRWSQWADPLTAVGRAQGEVCPSSLSYSLRPNNCSSCCSRLLSGRLWAQPRGWSLLIGRMRLTFQLSPWGCITDRNMVQILRARCMYVRGTSCTPEPLIQVIGRAGVRVCRE
jgi:hypothetical protein